MCQLQKVSGPGTFFSLYSLALRLRERNQVVLRDEGVHDLPLELRAVVMQVLYDDHLLPQLVGGGANVDHLTVVPLDRDEPNQLPLARHHDLVGRGVDVAPVLRLGYEVVLGAVCVVDVGDVVLTRVDLVVLTDLDGDTILRF